MTKKAFAGCASFCRTQRMHLDLGSGVKRISELDIRSQFN
jgi:hypothetical protein